MRWNTMPFAKIVVPTDMRFEEPVVIVFDAIR
jgi:hypothetical protein